MSFEGMTKREAFELIAVLRERVSALEAERAEMKAEFKALHEATKASSEWRSANGSVDA